MGNASSRAVMVLGCYLSSLATVSFAEVVLDGSLGTSGSLSGPDYQITNDMGQLRGSNLFHSFSEFNLNSGESATFGGAVRSRVVINNIIARVTGGNASTIDGTINSTSGADFYFINPNGVVFGQNASLNVGGSFYVSTANYLAFSDGSRFDASVPANTVLTSASPSAFGFLTSSPAGITVNSADLSVSDGMNLGFVGGQILMDGHSRDNVDVDYTDFIAANGRIELVSLTSQTEVQITTAGLQTMPGTVFGDITLQDGVVLDASGEPGGTIYIRGNNVVIEDSALISANLGKSDHAGTAIDIQAQDLLISYTAEGQPTGFAYRGGLEATVLSGGDGGDIRIVADSLQMQGDPNATAVTSHDSAFNGAVATISAEVLGEGNGGDIYLEVDQITLQDNSHISTKTSNLGNAGNIDIVTRDMTVSGESGTAIVTSSSSLPPRGTGFRSVDLGDAGDLSVTADTIVLRGGSADADVGFFSSSNQGFLGSDAGNITLDARLITVQDGAQIDAGRTRGNGNGGTINITTEELTVKGKDNGGRAAVVRAGFFGDATLDQAGHGGDIIITTDSLVLADNGRIENVNTTFAQTGDITINTDTLDISSGGLIISGLIDNDGIAGDINITADSIKIHSTEFNGELYQDGQLDSRYHGLLGGTGIVTVAIPSTEEKSSINITTSDLTILDGGEINASSWSNLGGGDINIIADDILMSGKNATRDVASRIVSASEVQDGGRFVGGNGGDIDIQTRRLTMRDNALITAYSYSLSDAGNIIINASDSIKLTDSRIATDTTRSNTGGNITVNATNMLHLIKSEINASSSGTNIDGGNINIDPIYVILDNSSIVADSRSGAGGNITIVAQNFLATPDSTLSATSQSGIDGNVVVDAPDSQISSELEAVPEPAADPKQHFRNDCVAIGSGYSRFVVAKEITESNSSTNVFPSVYVDMPVSQTTKPVTEKVEHESGKPQLVLSKNGMDCLGKRT